MLFFIKFALTLSKLIFFIVKRYISKYYNAMYGIFYGSDNIIILKIFYISIF